LYDCAIIARNATSGQSQSTSQAVLRCYENTCVQYFRFHLANTISATRFKASLKFALQRDKLQGLRVLELDINHLHLFIMNKLQRIYEVAETEASARNTPEQDSGQEILDSANHCPERLFRCVHSTRSGANPLSLNEFIHGLSQQGYGLSQEGSIWHFISQNSWLSSTYTTEDGHLIEAGVPYQRDFEGSSFVLSDEPQICHVRNFALIDSFECSITQETLVIGATAALMFFYRCALIAGTILEWHQRFFGSTG
jgi:hypothetical protein